MGKSNFFPPPPIDMALPKNLSLRTSPQAGAAIRDTLCAASLVTRGIRIPMSLRSSE